MIRLYQFSTCPYCRRVVAALERLGIPYETIEVDPDDMDEVLRLTGDEMVPVIVDTSRGDLALNESARIIDYLERTYGPKRRA